MYCGPRSPAGKTVIRRSHSKNPWSSHPRSPPRVVFLPLPWPCPALLGLAITGLRFLRPGAYGTSPDRPRHPPARRRRGLPQPAAAVVIAKMLVALAQAGGSSRWRAELQRLPWNLSTYGKPARARGRRSAASVDNAARLRCRAGRCPQGAEGHPGSPEICWQAVGRIPGRPHGP